MKTYENFTEALVDLFSTDKSICEIGLSDDIFPYVSLNRRLSLKEYLFVNLRDDEEYKISFRITGLDRYKNLIENFFNYFPSNLNLISSTIHNILLESSSVDSVLFFKSYAKITGNIIGSKERKVYVDSLIRKYQELNIENLSEEEYLFIVPYTYRFLVLEEARRIGKNKIVIIPEEKNILEELKFYAERTNQSMESMYVKRPCLKIDNYEIAYRQNNLTKMVIVLHINKSKEAEKLKKRDILDYLKSRTFETELFRMRVEEISKKLQ